MKFPPPDASSYRDVVRRALAEDLGAAGDNTTEATVPADARARGRFLVKADCVLAGLDVALETFRLLEPGVQIRVRKADGERCAPGGKGWGHLPLPPIPHGAFQFPVG